jgi:hypothetical protein
VTTAAPEQEDLIFLADKMSELAARLRQHPDDRDLAAADEMEFIIRKLAAAAKRTGDSSVVARVARTQVTVRELVAMMRTGGPA